MNLIYPLILASKSPRRQELLKAAGFRFSCRTKDTNEDFPANMSAALVASYLAQKKAEAFQDELEEDQLLMSADTVVVVDDQILGKPANKSEAAEMLRLLSGKSHKVISGVCLLHRKNFICTDDTTEVYFRTLSSQEIDFYIENYKPFDKAGAYGIQEWIGMIGIEKIIGSYYTVMGLPIHKVYTLLQDFAVPKVQK